MSSETDDHELLDWKKANKRLFRSLTDDFFTGKDISSSSEGVGADNGITFPAEAGKGKDISSSSVGVGVVWRDAVVRLLSTQHSKFRQLIYDLKKDYFSMPRHDSEGWTANHCYELLSKLLCSIWFLMVKELVPPSPRDFRLSCGSKAPLSSDRECVSYKADELKDFEKYENGMRKYFRYQFSDEQGMNELINTFYQNLESKYYLNIRNSKDRERLNDEKNQTIIDKIVKRKNPSVGDFLEDFVFVHKEQLKELCYDKPNCRSTPQRVFPLANVLPTEGTVGVLELGCHRGDVGLALLNLDFVLANPERYFTEQFQKFIGDARNLRWICNPIQKYFGVTDTLVLDDDWALAQWGTHSKMRKQLRRFHYDFKSGNNKRFLKIKADLCDVDSYVMEAIDFLKEMNNLVVLTSYALCFVPFDKRRKLAQAIRTIQMYYKTANPDGQFFWYNQGRSVDEIFDEESSKNVAERFYLGEMCFKGAFLFGVDLLQLANDSHTGWRNPLFSLLCQESNKDECESFVEPRRGNEQNEQSSEFKTYTPSLWNKGLYCYDDGKYDELVNDGPSIAQETSIYANIVFPMLESPGSKAGDVQRGLESQKMCYVGSVADDLKKMANIEECRTIWRERGIPVLDWVAYDPAKETISFSSLSKRLKLKNESLRIVSAYSGIDRTRWEGECSYLDKSRFNAIIKEGLEKYEKLILEPQRTFGEKDDTEYIIYVPIIESGLKAIALPAYMDQDMIDPKKGKFAFSGDLSDAQNFNRLKVVNMAKRLALDAYRAVNCQDFGVVELVYSERFGLQVSRIQPLPYFWEYVDSSNKDDDIIVPRDIVEISEDKNKTKAKEKRFCEGFGLPKKALKNGFFYAWDKMYRQRGSRLPDNSIEPIDTLLNVLCNMAQRDDGDRRRFMHVLWYDKE